MVTIEDKQAIIGFSQTLVQIQPNKYSCDGFINSAENTGQLRVRILAIQLYKLACIYSPFLVLQHLILHVIRQLAIFLYHPCHFISN